MHPSPYTTFALRINHRNWLEAISKSVHDWDEEEAEVEERKEQGTDTHCDSAGTETEFLPVLLRAHRGKVASLEYSFPDIYYWSGYNWIT